MKTNFKHSLKKGKANGKDSWILSVHYDGLRKRKYFQTFVEAKNFDVVEWLGKQKKTEVCGDDTLMAAAGWQEETISRSGSPVLQVRFHSDIPFSRLPLVFWDRPEIRGDLRTARARVVFLDVTAGANSCELAMESK